MKVVIDASAIIAVALTETDAALIAATRDVLGRADKLAPAIMPIEVAGAIAMAAWIGRRSTADTDSAWRLANDIIHAVEFRASDDIHSLVALCRQYRLRGADACYLQLSLEQRASLLTGDKALATAARAAGIALAYDPVS